MLDCATGPSENPDIAPPRLLAIDLVIRSSASLRLIASHLGGDAGLALICVLCDMIIDPTVDPCTGRSTRRSRFCASLGWAGTPKSIGSRGCSNGSGARSEKSRPLALRELAPRARAGLDGNPAVRGVTMNFQIDHHDYVSILADVRRRGRLLEPVFRNDLSVLLGRRLPSGLPRVADAARDGNLVRG